MATRASLVPAPSQKESVRLCRVTVEMRGIASPHSMNIERIRPPRSMLASAFERWVLLTGLEARRQFVKSTVPLWPGDVGRETFGKEAEDAPPSSRALRAMRASAHARRRYGPVALPCR